MTTATLPVIRQQDTSWWVVRTAEGLKALPYRANSRSGAIGPFSCKATADAKIAELEQARLRRRARIEIATCAFAAGLLCVVSWMLP